MLIYFSEDRFDKYSWSRTVRELARRVGTRFFVLYYPLTVLFFSGFGGLSFQLPDSIQIPYWLAVLALFSAYLIWTAEGMLGTKIVRKGGILPTGVSYFLEISTEGMQIIAEGLVRVWRRMLAKLGHPTTGPINAKQAMRLFISAGELIVISFAYFVEHWSGFNLFYAFGVPLWTIIIASVIIGVFKKRKRKSKTSA